MEARRNFDAAAAFLSVIYLKAPFDARPVGLYAGYGGLVRLGFGSLHDAYLSAHAGLVPEAELLLEAHLRNPEPEVTRAGQRREGHLCERGWLAGRENRALQTCHDTAVLPIDFDVTRANPEILIQRSAGTAPEIHVDRAMHASAQERLRPRIVQANDSLAEAAAAACLVAGPRKCRVLDAAARFGIQKAVEQHHPREADREALRCAHFGLIQFRGASLVDGHLVFERWGCRRSLMRGCQILAQLAD